MAPMWPKFSRERGKWSGKSKLEGDQVLPDHPDKLPTALWHDPVSVLYINFQDTYCDPIVDAADNLAAWLV